MFSAEKSDPTPHLDYIADVVGGSEKRRPWANCSCNYFRTSPTCMPTVPQRYRRTDRQSETAGRTTYDSNTSLALRASRGETRAHDRDKQW